MAFKKIEANALPPRRWAIVGYPGDGKSTFAAAMRGPILMIDADGRRNELRGADIYSLSEEATDHLSIDRIQTLLEDGMPSSGMQTIVVDSVTSIISPIITQAMLDTPSGRTRNKNQIWVTKAETMRALQSAICRYNTDVLLIWHLEDNKLNGERQTRETLTEIEQERLVRSLNAKLRIVREGDKRGIKVEWARTNPGAAGKVFWDDQGLWRGVPERIEAVIESQPAKPVFASAAAAVQWAVSQGAFTDEFAAQLAYDDLKADLKPRTAAQMFEAWQTHVCALDDQRRRA
jgi:hypothetical protein